MLYDTGGISKANRWSGGRQCREHFQKCLVARPTQGGPGMLSLCGFRWLAFVSPCLSLGFGWNLGSLFLLLVQSNLSM